MTQDCFIFVINLVVNSLITHIKSLNLISNFALLSPPQFFEKRKIMQLFLAETASDLDEIYHLRYRAYRSIGAIDENPSQSFSDQYDNQDNAFIFGLRSGGGGLLWHL